MTVHILGIRHHGPGSARSLLAALDEIQPDAVLIEGPPDADALIHLIGDEEMEPPVALLIYAPDDTRQAVYYPFALYSPEYQAIRWALDNQRHVRFMDLPQTHQFAYNKARLEAMEAELEKRKEEMEKAQEDGDQEAAADWQAQVEKLREEYEAKLAHHQKQREEMEMSERVRLDPLGWLGKAAGYNDGERWWEHIIEQRRDDLSGVFQAVLEAMTELRETAGEVTDENEQRREAFMRTTIRNAQLRGYKRIAVVCGAWHGPALVEGSDMYHDEAADAETLADMPTQAVESTWIPWTHGRLARGSGYGAGIQSPGWYYHLWTTEQEVVIRWLTKVASFLREADLDASTAQIIDTVRLVETLTAIRGYALPGLAELNEAIQATMVFGAQEPMNLIHRDLVVGERIGTVPPTTPMVPLVRDLRETRKRLDGGARKKRKSRDSDQIKFFKFDPDKTDLNLDLRADIDLDRSQLLHRLRILGVPWGNRTRSDVVARGTFHEDWTLKWEPEFEIKLIEQSIYGNTIPQAATGFVINKAQAADDLPTLTALVNDVLHADLPTAATELIAQLKRKAAVAADINALMDALPPLVDVKTGHHAKLSVRGVTLGDVNDVIDGLLTRINIGLPNACASLDDDAADAMFKRIVALHDSVLRLRDEDYMTAWYATLDRLMRSNTAHGLVAGRAARLLLDVNEIDPEQVASLMRLAISTAQDPPAAAAWVEGFLRGSGLILLHDDALLGVLDRWIMSLNEDAFVALLPLLRRTFSTFSGPERRQIGERIRKTDMDTVLETSEMVAVAEDADIDLARADAMLPVLQVLLGLQDEEDMS
ncbi:MAG: DUF5682 family protein [Chloroflexota bacterium]